MLYLAFISPIFRKSSLDELKRLSSFRIVGDFNNFLVIESKKRRLHMLKGMKLVYCILPLCIAGNVSGKRYRESILATIRRSGLGMGSRLKLECVDLNSRTHYSAKDLEVWEGERLEKLGYKVDIENPEVLAYFVLLDMKCYVGHMYIRDMRRTFVNPLRHYHAKRSVSRSELKIEQAFDEFGIRKGGGIAIDLGAAPGGWSCYLAKAGYRVIAIDNGRLNTSAIRECGVDVKETRHMAIGRGEVRQGVLHVRERSDMAAKRLKIRNVDMIVDDMNIDCAGTYEIMKRYTKFLAREAEAVVTIKCITKYIPRYVRQAKMLFSRDFAIKGIKVLPANRQEFTLFMTYLHRPAKSIPIYTSK